ncbi:MAG: hypothetical protein NVS9B3_15290 [Gemmatimonadaceae bacterium]
MLLDPNAARDGQEVLAVPSDPTLHAGAGEKSGRGGDRPPPNDSIARLTRARDSLATLDARFQRERSALNAEAAELDALPPGTAEYARRFDSFRRRKLSADSLRATRDRQRALVDRLATRLGESARQTRSSATTPYAVDRSSPDGRRPTRYPVRGSAPLTVRLAPGTWWLTVTPRHSSQPPHFTRTVLRAGRRDTISIK